MNLKGHQARAPTFEAVLPFLVGGAGLALASSGGAAPFSPGSLRIERISTFSTSWTATPARQQAAGASTNINRTCSRFVHPSHSMPVPYSLCLSLTAFLPSCALLHKKILITETAFPRC